jgi:hypothetical protein
MYNKGIIENIVRIIYPRSLQAKKMELNEPKRSQTNKSKKKNTKKDI